MIAWLRRVDAWLDGLGVRRSVLLAVGSAGLAAALVAGLGLTEVGRVGAAGRAAGRGGGSVAAGAVPAQEVFWRARCAEATGADGAGRAVRAVGPALAEARDRADGGAERAAAADAVRAWRRYLEARAADPPVPSAAAAAGAAAARAVDALAAAARQEARDRAAAADGAYVRAKALLLLVFCAGALGAAGLVRLLVGAVVAWAGARGRRLVEFLRGEEPGPGPAGDEAAAAETSPSPEGLACAGLGEVARSMAAATALMHATARRQEARSAAVEAESGWWLRPTRP